MPLWRLGWSARPGSGIRNCPKHDGRAAEVAVDGEVIHQVTVTAVWAGYIGIEGDRGTMEYRGLSIQSFDDGSSCEKRAAETGISLFRLRDADVESPQVEKEVKPRYLVDAMTRKTQGSVQVEAIVLPDGTVGPTCLKKGIDPDLDLQAIAAVKAWRFKPGRRAGAPVAVLVDVEMQFKLH